MTITTVGIDLAKNVFAVHCVDQHGKTVLVKPKVSRAALPELIASLPPCVIGMEACSGAHYWARLFRQYGHEPRLMAAKFVSPYRMAGNAAGGIIDTLESSWADKEARVRLMKKILGNDEYLKYAPPESKGAAIAALIETSFWDEVASPASHQGEACEGGTTFASRKRAILAVLRWVQSKREYENIMQHLSTTIGEKGDWKANEARVIAFLAEGEQPREYGADASFIPGAQKIIITPSHYAENLHAIYTHLPDAPAVSPGHPNEFMLPLTPVSPLFLHSCTTYITTQHGR